jgi:N-methylhydantoinase A
MKRLAVDTGGTFTDIVYIDDETGKTIQDKVSTTPRDLAEGVMEAIRKINVNLSEISLFIHGTMTGLNTIAQRRGAKRAIMAVAHSILVIVYSLLKNGGEYRELGGNYFVELQPV